MSRNDLNQATKDFIASLPVPDAPLGAMSLGDFRQLQRDLNVQFSGDIPRDIETIDQQISGQNAKIHRAQDYDSRTMPTLLYIAGGAFVCSGLDNPAPKKMADGAQVIMLGHRLAPEHKISDSVDDIVNGIIYCLENSAQLNIGENIIIGGDSSGASFALAAMLNLRDSHPDMLAKIKHMVFISPAVDLSMAPAHCREYDEQDALFSAEAVTAVQTWLKDEDLCSPVVSPIYAESFAGLPPIHSIVAECDRLRSHEYALQTKCAASGVEYSNHICRGQVHAFLNWRGPLHAGEDPAQLVVAEIIKKYT